MLKTKQCVAQGRGQQLWGALPFQKTEVQFPVHLQSDSQVPLTPVGGDLKTLASQITCIHSCEHPAIHINKILNKSLIKKKKKNEEFCLNYFKK